MILFFVPELLIWKQNQSNMFEFFLFNFCISIHVKVIHDALKESEEISVQNNNNNNKSNNNNNNNNSNSNSNNNNNNNTIIITVPP